MYLLILSRHFFYFSFKNLCFLSFVFLFLDEISNFRNRLLINRNRNRWSEIVSGTVSLIVLAIGFLKTTDQPTTYHQPPTNWSTNHQSPTNQIHQPLIHRPPITKYCVVFFNILFTEHLWSVVYQSLCIQRCNEKG